MLSVCLCMHVCLGRRGVELCNMREQANYRDWKKPPTKQKSSHSHFLFSLYTTSPSLQLKAQI